jgi:two-component system sensor histidine kinase RstB
MFSYVDGIIEFLGVPLDEHSYLRLGPISSRIGDAIEAEMADWVRVLKRKIQSSEDVQATIRKVSDDLRLPLDLASKDSLPTEPLDRIQKGAPQAFYSSGKNYYVIANLTNHSDYLRIGPLPKVKDKADRSVNGAFSIWLMSILVSIGWLVNNLAKKFRRIEKAAIEISQGRFDARVDEKGAGESAVLASAFNLMATKTEASIRSKSELLQVVSHELRTPISRLRFAIELLDVSKDEQLKRSRMTIIRQSIDNLDAIVDEVLEYVRNEENDPIESRDKLEIIPGLEPMLDLFRLEYPSIDTQWCLNETDKDIEVWADRIAFHRVISNLLSNAFRYAKSKVLIHVYCNPESVFVDVEDDGPGIPEDKRQEVLAPFARLLNHRASFVSESEDGSSGKDDGDQSIGLGLGLTIVDRIVRQHGGSIEIHQGNLGGCLARTRWPVS